MATFGKTTIGGNNGNFYNTLKGWKGNVGEGGTITKISVYIPWSTNFRVSAYSGSDPATASLLWESASIAHGASGSWHDVDVPSVVFDAGGMILVAAHDANNSRLAYDVVSDGGISRNWTYGSMPDPLGAGASDVQISIYATYTPSVEKISNLVTSIANNIALIDNVITAINTIREMASNILTGKHWTRNLVSSTFNVLYSLINKVTSAITSKFAIRNLVSNITSLIHTINNKISNLVSSFYNIISTGVVSTLLTLEYNMTNIVSRMLSATYSMLNLISKQANIKWNVRVLVEAIKTLSWSLYNLINNALHLGYGIITKVSNVISLLYNITSKISSSISSLFTLSGLVNITRTMSWSLRNLVDISLDSGYNMIAKIFTTLKNIYNITILRVVTDFISRSPLHIRKLWRESGDSIQIISRIETVGSDGIVEFTYDSPISSYGSVYATKGFTETWRGTGVKKGIDYIITVESNTNVDVGDIIKLSSGMELVVDEKLRRGTGFLLQYFELLCKKR